MRCELIGKLHLRSRAAVCVLVVCALFAPWKAFAQGDAGDEQRVRSELAGMGKRGEAILKAREQVLEILQSPNACSDWFQEADPEAAKVLRSLHFTVVEHNAPYIYSRLNGAGERMLKHPWAASTRQNSGRDALIRLNATGLFFKNNLPVMNQDAFGNFVGSAGWQRLEVAGYTGNTWEARAATLLHELGHIIGRLPEDDDSWDGRSAENSDEVLRHCKREIHEVTHRRRMGQ